jgi:hypothetical protein
MTEATSVRRQTDAGLHQGLNRLGGHAFLNESGWREQFAERSGTRP